MKQDKPYTRIDRGWGEMKHTLDERMPVSKTYSNAWWLGLLTLLMAGSIIFGIHMFEIHSPTKSEFQQVAETVKPSVHIDEDSPESNIDIQKENPLIEKKKDVPVGQRDAFVPSGHRSNEQPVSINSNALAKTSNADSSTAPENGNFASYERENSLFISGVLPGSLNLLPYLPAIYPSSLESSSGSQWVYSRKYPAVTEIEYIPPIKFHLAVSAGVNYAPQLSMWGWSGRMTAAASLKKIDVGVFVGYGRHGKNSITTSVEFNPLAEPLPPEDMLDAEADQILNLGRVTKNYLEGLKYYEFGLVTLYKPHRILNFAFNVGWRKYHSVSYDTETRSIFPSQSGYPVQINFTADNTQSLFAELGAGINLGSNFSVNGGYHHEFSPLIDKPDGRYSGHSMYLSLKYML